jgi:hypothetical protein
MRARETCLWTLLSLATWGCGGTAAKPDGGGDVSPGSGGGSDEGRDAAAGRGGSGGAAAGSGGAAAGSGGTSAGSGGAASGSGGGSGTGGRGGSPGSGGAGGRGGSTGSGGRTGGGGATGSGGATAADTCRTDADCSQIVCITSPCSMNVCLLAPSGVRFCQLRSRQPVLPDSCADAPEPCCMGDGQCGMAPDGECIPNSFDYCGGAAPPRGNSCRYGSCRSDEDCTASPNGVCTAGYPRRCLYGPCRRNTDCTARSGGTCVLDTVAASCPSPAVFCRYAGDPCVRNADCVTPPGTPYPRVCVPNMDLQGTRCVDGGPFPP